MRPGRHIAPNGACPEGTAYGIVTRIKTSGYDVSWFSAAGVKLDECYLYF